MARNPTEASLPSGAAEFSVVAAVQAVSDPPKSCISPKENLPVRSVFTSLSKLKFESAMGVASAEPAISASAVSTVTVFGCAFGHAFLKFFVIWVFGFEEVPVDPGPCFFA